MTQQQWNECERLKARDLLQRIYEAFAVLPGMKMVTFERQTFSVIARDLEERGCAYYRSAIAVPLGRTSWVLSLGIAEDSPLSRPFGSDIAVFPLRESAHTVTLRALARTAVRNVRQAELHRHSMLVSMANGSIGTNAREGVYGKQVFFALRALEAVPYLSSAYECRGDYILYQSSTDALNQYHPELVPYLVRAFQRMLEADPRGL